ncbi:hypothetical protein SCOCK_80008 [Actinacidiphila cocklensis]|uniref:Uncharacterized protein n=1 Tax=Actinacidiphila cocklensis TaxID=887465 RepID=A0A9W4DZI3_9ACTN|nr:hypothetical protein SCOCK_80008 [Actinacidiphila cocklensis]
MRGSPLETEDLHAQGRRLAGRATAGRRRMAGHLHVPGVRDRRLDARRRDRLPAPDQRQPHGQRRAQQGTAEQPVAVHRAGAHDHRQVAGPVGR